MKPNFALSLSSDAIQLLHRAAGGWREVGAVSLAAADLAGELAVLRKTAVSLAPGGLRSKVIIPPGQIKYLSIDTPGLSTEARRREAAKALENATPYAVADLAFDISQDGPLTHIAAVARETLAEAQAFAEEHRLHPVSFVAIPDAAPFLGEPFFGVAEGIEDLIEPGETVEPDGIAVVVIGAVETSPTPLDVHSPVATAEVVPDPAGHPAPGASNRSSGEGSQSGTGKATTVSDSEKSPGDHSPNLSRDGAEPPRADPPMPVFAQETLTAEEIAEPPVVADTTPTKPDGAPAPGSDGAAAGSDKIAPLPADRDIPRATGPAAQDVARPSPKAEATGPAALAAARTSEPTDAPRKPTFSAARSAKPAAAPPAGSASRTPVGGAAAPRLTPQPDSSSLLQDPPPADDPIPAPARKPGFLSRRKPRKGAAAPVPAPAAAVRAVSSEAERMTVFGARSDDVGGKPRFLGLILTVVLLVFLAGVAAWAAVFLDDGIASLFRSDDTRAVASAPENQVIPEVIRLPQEADTAALDGADVAALDPVLSAEDGAVLDALRSLQEPPERPIISEQEAAARYAVNGIWPLAPRTLPGRAQLDTEPAFQIGIDDRSGASDAIALPPAQAFDTDVAPTTLPPPFGQTVRLGDTGLPIPTDSGVVAPGGYTLIAASPPAKPPQQLPRLDAGPAADSPTRDTELATFRPIPRPSGLAETTERAQLGGVTISELAAFRPSRRPASLSNRVTEAATPPDADARARAAAEAATAAATLTQPPQDDAPAIETATEFATTASLRPDIRPRNFARVVERAQPKRDTRVAAAATVSPRTVTPSLPSKASVAKSATTKNAINLRRVNLIGVYGKPSSRRALVRLSNGRYQKVRVGDRIDGGRVSAIGNSELRYTKGGRNLVLKIPQG